MLHQNRSPDGAETTDAESVWGAVARVHRQVAWQVGIGLWGGSILLVGTALMATFWGSSFGPSGLPRLAQGYQTLRSDDPPTGGVLALTGLAVTVFLAATFEVNREKTRRDESVAVVLDEVARLALYISSLVSYTAFGITVGPHGISYVDSTVLALGGLLCSALGGVATVRATELQAQRERLELDLQQLSALPSADRHIGGRRRASLLPWRRLTLAGVVVMLIIWAAADHSAGLVAPLFAVGAAVVWTSSVAAFLYLATIKVRVPSILLRDRAAVWVLWIAWVALVALVVVTLLDAQLAVGVGATALMFQPFSSCR